MAAWLCPLTFLLFAHLIMAQFVFPPDGTSTSTGGSNLQLTVGSNFTISWELRSDAIEAQNKLYLWYYPGADGCILNGNRNTTLSYYNWTVSAEGLNLADFTSWHMTLYPEDKLATAGNGYFSTVAFLVVDAPPTTTTTTTTTGTSSTSTTSTSSTPTSSTLSPSTSTTSTSSTSSTSFSSTPVAASATVTSSESSPPNPGGLITGAKAELVVGIGLTVVVLAALGFFFGKRHQQKRSEQTPAAPTPHVAYTQYYEPAELAGPHYQQPAMKDSSMVDSLS